MVLDTSAAGRALIIMGILLVIIGFFLVLDSDFLSWPGNLPGDIQVEGENFSVYIPVTTMILLSIVINLLLRLFTRLF